MEQNVRLPHPYTEGTTGIRALDLLVVNLRDLSGALRTSLKIVHKFTAKLTKVINHQGLDEAAGQLNKSETTSPPKVGMAAMKIVKEVGAASVPDVLRLCLPDALGCYGTPGCRKIALALKTKPSTDRDAGRLLLLASRTRSHVDAMLWR
jgi:hypothetical protein